MTVLTVDLLRPGSLVARDMILTIVAFARRKGIDQATLARRAGISPETLSRLKRAGACRLVTAVELARAAGLGRLDIHERATSNVAVTMAAQKLSAGRRRSIGADDLIEALSTGVVVKRYRGHLCGFFEELPLESVHDMILDHGLDYCRLVLLAEELGAEGETVEWCKEMAGDGLAGAA